MQYDLIADMLVSIALGISILIIISIGLAVIFGMMGIINLAHGQFLMLGAYFTLVGVRAGINIWLAMLLAALAVGAFGLLIERLLIHRLYGRLADSMLATWGLGLILAQVVSLIFGPSTEGVPTPLSNVQVGNYSISGYSFALIGASMLTLLVVLWVFTRTPYGTMARASTQIPGMASAVGVNTRMINMWTFGFGAALAGLGGALLAPIAGVTPSMGQAYIAQAFMTVIVGGAGVLTGTSAAAGVLGGFQYLISYLSNPFLGQGALLVIAIVVLRIMPTGLSGYWGRQL